MRTDEQIIDDMVYSFKVHLVADLEADNRKATGKTIDAIEESTGQLPSELSVPRYLDALEYGRKPTSPDAPASDPTLLDRIKEWCAARGIEEGAAYAITKKIHEQGYAGTPGLITGLLKDESLETLFSKYYNELADNYMYRVANVFDMLNHIK